MLFVSRNVEMKKRQIENFDIDRDVQDERFFFLHCHESDYFGLILKFLDVIKSTNFLYNFMVAILIWEYCVDVPISFGTITNL